MPAPLWQIRKRKGLSINELAAKSGVPAISIVEYESGQAIRSADLPKLAKALYVEEWDIKLQSTPRPRTRRAEPTQAGQGPAAQAKKVESSATEEKRIPAPARPSQIEHLLALTVPYFGKDRTALEADVSKRLEELTRREASELLSHYQRKLVDSKTSQVGGESRAKRKRAYLPEGVDEFELQYLTAKKEAGALLTFTLFDGQQLSGYVVGFGPYSITIHKERTSDEVTLQKLAIAHYRTTRGPASAGDDRPGDDSIGDNP